MEIVTLAPGDSQSVNFQFTPTEAKRFTVNVDGLTESFTAILSNYITNTVVSCPPSREGERINIVLQVYFISDLYVYRAYFVSPELKAPEMLRVAVGREVGYLPTYYSRRTLKGEIWAEDCVSPVLFQPPSPMNGHFEIKVYEVDDPALPQQVIRNVQQMDLEATLTS